MLFDVCRFSQIFADFCIFLQCVADVLLILADVCRCLEIFQIFADVYRFLADCCWFLQITPASSFDFPCILLDVPCILQCFAIEGCFCCRSAFHSEIKVNSAAILPLPLIYTADVATFLPLMLLSDPPFASFSLWISLHVARFSLRAPCILLYFTI